MASFSITDRVTAMLIKEADLRGREVGFYATVSVNQSDTGGQTPCINILAVEDGPSVGEQIAARLTLGELEPNQERVAKVVEEILSALDRTHKKVRESSSLVV